MHKLVGFTGMAGAGKDTAGELLIGKRYFHESFARRAKNGMKVMFDLTPAQVFGTKEEKEAPISHLSHRRPISARELLQTGCTDWARDMIDPDIWIYPVEKSWDNLSGVPGFPGMVITDVRFNNEAEWIRSKGGVVIWIRDDNMTFGMNGEVHVSESGVSRHLIDAEVYNHKISKELFHSDVQYILDFLADGNRQEHAANEPVSASSIGWAKAEADRYAAMTLRELITDWADKAFPNRTITNALTKLAMEELPEYLMNQSDPMELADMGILLYDIAHLANIDLDAAIREKMVINRKRTWAVDPLTGLLRHTNIEESKPKYPWPDIDLEE